VEGLTSTARCWVKEVRELSYDIDDFLDELVHGHGLHAATAQNANLLARLAKHLHQPWERGLPSAARLWGASSVGHERADHGCEGEKTDREEKEKGPVGPTEG
jgi:hypothetical protein